MKNRIITISREFGSGGRTIGRKVAEKLGIPCYDAELIHKIAQESGFAESYIKDAGEYALLCDLMDQLCIIARNAQFLCDLSADSSAAAAKLTADSNNTIFHQLLSFTLNCL